jgi:hypothetical protein
MIKILFFIIKEMYYNKFTLILTLIIGLVALMTGIVIVDNITNIISGTPV